MNDCTYQIYKWIAIVVYLLIFSTLKVYSQVIHGMILDKQTLGSVENAIIQYGKNQKDVVCSDSKGSPYVCN
jgi:hypothetical protein